MLALVLAVLSAVAGLPPAGAGWTGTEASESGREVVVTAMACCETAADGTPAGPCGPGDTCPPFAGCCACVSCAKRVADAPPSAAPVGHSGETVERLLAGASSGIDGEGAVWHPPRG